MIVGLQLSNSHILNYNNELNVLNDFNTLNHSSRSKRSNRSSRSNRLYPLLNPPPQSRRSRGGGQRWGLERSEAIELLERFEPFFS
jgi:hypothetical protein